MEIAFIHPSSPNSEGTGATYSATRIVEGLVKNGHDVTVYCTSRYDELEGNHQFKVKKLDRSLSGDPPFHPSLVLNKQIREREKELSSFDIVHSYIMTPIPAIGEIGRKNPVTTIVTLNAYNGICPKNDLLFMGSKHCKSRSVAKCTACSIASSFNDRRNPAPHQIAHRLPRIKEIRDNYKHMDGINRFQALAPHVKDKYASFGFPSERIQVIPNILDESFLIPHDSGFEEPFNLLYIGHLIKNKGVDKIVPIIKILNNSRYTFNITIVGSGGQEEKIKKEAQKQSVENRIDLLGSIPNDRLPKLYATHDIFLYPGRWEEPFGRVFLEALAAGLPIVGANVGSIAEIVGDGGIVTNGTPSGFKNQILDLIKNKKLEPMSDAGPKQARKYKSEIIIPMIEHLYNSGAKK